MNRLILVVALSAATWTAAASNLCSTVPFSKAEAEQGKLAFDSHCAFCHQYSMAGREPGNYQNETPDIRILSASDVKSVDSFSGSIGKICATV